MELKTLLEIAVSRNASDLHLLENSNPTVRIDGDLYSLIAQPVLTSYDIENMIYSILDEHQKELLITNRELDFSLVLDFQNNTKVRFRVNTYFQRNSLSVALRVIPSQVKSVDELNLPSAVKQLSNLKQGFVLVTGGSGQGKSTTIASILSEINDRRKVHIITVEDPIEYMFPTGKGLISQREMFKDTHSWNNALKSILREDPDVVYIGEMRDYETVSSALSIAETGHLVFSTLHTNSASQSIDRILDFFPSDSKNYVSMQLSMVLSAIISQRLFPSLLGGRTPVCEVLLATTPVKNAIREQKTHLIDNTIQTSRDVGMLLFEDHLKTLVSEGKIDHNIALEYALRPDVYLQLMNRQ